MDIWLSKASTGMGLAFLPVWLVAAVGAITLGLRWERRPHERRRTRRMARGLAAVVGSYLLLLGCVALTFKFAVAHRFESLVARPPDALVVRSGHDRMTMSEPSDILKLLRLIQRGESVASHHSHPVDEIYLSFPRPAYTYALGRDAERAGEFWLIWVAYPGSGASRDLAFVRQFHSEELSRLLETYSQGGGG